MNIANEIAENTRLGKQILHIPSLGLNREGGHHEGAKHCFTLPTEMGARQNQVGHLSRCIRPPEVVYTHPDVTMVTCCYGNIVTVINCCYAYIVALQRLSEWRQSSPSAAIS